MPNFVQPAPERVLSTLQEDGSRRWLTPRLANGQLLRQRRTVAYGLILLLTALPLIQINGKPAVLLDVTARQFTLFGYTFLPTDMVLLALLAISWFATIFLTTAIAGRVWCGWACPQTVYMEFVYRPIERLCLGRAGVGGNPKAGLSPVRYLLMHLVFVLISLVITHTLLSYFVGAAQLWHWVASNPVEHPWAFITIAVSSLAVWYNFVFFREQMCIVACPYGRFQSVLFDPHSRPVRYNGGRGEPRTKLQSAKRTTVSLPVRNGDCVDCSMCVQVCPTGIDIRDGVQLECINCAQCIDACDNVMRKIGRPERLIGYYSQAELEGGRSRVLRPRVVLYSLVSVGFLAVFLVLILTRKPFDASITRNIGLPFLVNPQGQIENTMRLTIRNRTSTPQTFTVVSQTRGISLAGDTASFTVPGNDAVVRAVNLLADPAAVPGGMMTASVVVRGQGDVQRALECQFYAPGGR